MLHSVSEISGYPAFLYVSSSGMLISVSDGRIFGIRPGIFFVKPELCRISGQYDIRPTPSIVLLLQTWECEGSSNRTGEGGAKGYWGNLGCFFNSLRPSVCRSGLEFWPGSNTTRKLFTVNYKTQCFKTLYVVFLFTLFVRAKNFQEYFCLSLFYGQFVLV